MEGFMGKTKKHPTTIKPDPDLMHSSSMQINSEFKSDSKAKTLKEMGFYESTPNISVMRKKGLESFTFEEKLTIMANHNLDPPLVIVIGGVQFNCHLMVLQCYSLFFKKFRNEKIIILPVEKVDATTFSLIYKWMIGKDPLLASRNLIRLFRASKFLQIQSLLTQIWSCLIDVLPTGEIAFGFFKEAKELGVPEILDLMVQKIENFFLILVASKDFIILDVKDLVKLISSMIGVNNEAEVLMSVVRWLNYDWEQRKKHTLTLIQEVRLGLMCPQFISMLKMSKELEVIRIIKMPNVQRLLDDALRYSVMHYFYSNDLFREWLNEEKMPLLNDRKWIYDRGCNYHHRSWCNYPYVLTYATFLEYLEELKLVGMSHRFMLESAMDDVENGFKYCCRSDISQQISETSPRIVRNFHS